MYICIFIVLYLKTMSLSSLKIMKKSPITEHSNIYTSSNLVAIHSTCKHNLIGISYVYD